MAAEYPELLVDLGEQLGKQLEALGLSPDLASEEAFKLTEFVRKHWGGQDVYVPKGLHLELAEKYRVVYETWKAEGFHPGLPRRFDLTMQRLRQIVKAVRLSRRQNVDAPQLPFAPAM